MTTYASLTDIATDFASHLDGAEFADQGYETYLYGGLPADIPGAVSASFTVRVHPFDKYTDPTPVHSELRVTVTPATTVAPVDYPDADTCERVGLDSTGRTRMYTWQDVAAAAIAMLDAS